MMLVPLLEVHAHHLPWLQSEEQGLTERAAITGGLAATAFVNIAFGMSSAYPLLLAFWALNGILQVRGQGLLPCIGM